MAGKKKTRIDLRKNRAKPPRDHTWTGGFRSHGYADEATVNDERVRAKGELSRKRTIVEQEGDPSANASLSGQRVVDGDDCLRGRVLRVHGLHSIVEAESNDPAAPLQNYQCTVRGLLKNMVTDERSIVTTGDYVWFRPLENPGEGIIERVEPRQGVLTRASRQREHVLVANVDQLVIVMSLVDPELKPHLIDRYLASAIQGELAPILCLNKADLVETQSMQRLLGSYSQLGIPTILTSAHTGEGIGRLNELLLNKSTVFSGQSGVGKSSLLNAIQPDLALKVRTVSGTNSKGRHTTTTSQLIRLEMGGWVVDTPGVRTLALWEIVPAEIAGFFPEIRPFVNHCAFPDCTHTTEQDCAVKRAVDRRYVSLRRYHSYLGILKDCETK